MRRPEDVGEPRPERREGPIGDPSRPLDVISTIGSLIGAFFCRPRPDGGELVRRRASTRAAQARDLPGQFFDDLEDDASQSRIPATRNTRHGSPATITFTRSVFLRTRHDSAFFEGKAGRASGTWMLLTPKRAAYDRPRSAPAIQCVFSLAAAPMFSTTVGQLLLFNLPTTPDTFWLSTRYPQAQGGRA